jgi:hypothetical protein
MALGKAYTRHGYLLASLTGSRFGYGGKSGTVDANILPPFMIAMKKSAPAASPKEYVAALDGWRRACVEELRATVQSASSLEEVIKWGHLVYLANGPVLLIRAEANRVLLGFWRGQRLRNLEPRLKPGGKYEMATLELREGVTVDPAIVHRLTREAVALNRKLGDPQLAAEQR